MSTRFARVAAALGATVLLGAGPAAVAAGAGRPESPAPGVRAVPTSAPKPGDVLPTTGRKPASVTASVRAPSVIPSATAPTIPATPRAAAAGTPWWQWVAVGAVGLLVGAGGCYLLLRPRRRVPPAPVPANRPPPGPVEGTDDNLATLVSSVIAARDLLDPQSVLSQRLGAALSGGGVQELLPVGQPFDPSRHRAVETAPTTDPAAADRIAEVQRVGYRDARHTIRPPEVVVYRLEANR